MDAPYYRLAGFKVNLLVQTDNVILSILLNKNRETKIYKFHLKNIK